MIISQLLICLLTIGGQIAQTKKEKGDDDPTAVIKTICFGFINAIIYIIVAILFIIRMKTLSKFGIESAIIKFFYILLGIGTGIKLFSFCLIVILLFAYQLGESTITTNRLDDTLFFILYHVSEPILMVEYIMLFWQLIFSYYFNHIQHSKDIPSYKSTISKVKWMLGRTKIVFSLIIIFFLAAIIVYIIFVSGKIDSQDIYYIYGGINTGIVAICIGGMGYQYIKYSGSPYKSEKHKKRLKKFRITIFFWTFSRLFKGIVDLACNKFLLYMQINDISGSSSTTDEAIEVLEVVSILVIIELITCVIPIIISLNESFMKIFHIQEKAKRMSTKIAPLISEPNPDWDKLDIDQSSRPNLTIGDVSVIELLDKTQQRESFISKQMKANFLDNLHSEPMENIMKQLSHIFLSSNCLIIKDEYAVKKNGLGRLVTTQLDCSNASKEFLDKFPYENPEHIFMCRIIKFARVTTYVVEDFYRELAFYLCSQLVYLVPIIGVILDNAVLSIITPKYPFSLHQIIHGEEKPSNQKKWNIIVNLTNSLTFMHASGIVHGHLTPHNIYVNGEQIFIGDYGFEGLRKFAGVFINYKNKSSYSPPEMLQTKANTVTNATMSTDIYSFGFIVWEIFTEKVPFNVTKTELYNFVVDGDFRPQIPEEIDIQVQQLIRSCWQKEESRRPTFEQIQKHIQKINNH